MSVARLQDTIRLCLCTFAVTLVGGLYMSDRSASAEEFWSRDALTGSWDGARKRLSDQGIDLSLTYKGDLFSNLSGGLKIGTTYEDLIGFGVDTDFERLVGWEGGSGHITLYQIDDSGMNAGDLTGSISDVSNIDARPTFRLFTLYVQQAFGNGGSFRIGQLAAGDEFFISETAANLINGTFGWANIVDDNLPGGGPAYPLAAPGARLKLDPSDDLKVLAAVFSGNPAGECPRGEDPEICNKHGTTFSFAGGALLMGEVQYRPGTGGRSTVAPRSTYRVGGWYLTDDVSVDAFGQGVGGKMVSPASASPGSMERSGNWGVYGIADRTVWSNGRSGLALFLRAAAAPADRNIVSFYIDGGFGITGLFGARPDDSLTFGVAYSKISSDASALDRARRRASGLNTPIRQGETALELTYHARMTPWWTLQPDVQYIVSPGGNVPDPNNPSRAVGDAFLLGLRTTLTF